MGSLASEASVRRKESKVPALARSLGRSVASLLRFLASLATHHDYPPGPDDSS